eukprot:7278384-Lingulodinium_polyedra.AAC.1
MPFARQMHNGGTNEINRGGKIAKTGAHSRPRLLVAQYVGAQDSPSARKSAWFHYDVVAPIVSETGHLLQPRACGRPSDMDIVNGISTEPTR